MRVDSSSGRGAAVREIVRLVTGWLPTGDDSDYPFLEHPSLEARAS